MKKDFVGLLPPLLVWALVSCSQLAQPAVITKSQLTTLLPSRQAEFVDTLSISAELIDLSIAGQPKNLKDRHQMTVFIEITNTSSQSILFKKPRSTGFTGQRLGGFPSCFNDVGIVISNPINVLMDVGGTTQFEVADPFRSCIQEFMYHTKDDFVELSPGSSYSYTFTGALPIVHFENKSGSENLPAGKYNLYVGYGNDYVGYQLPEYTTPPANLTYLSKPETEFVDLNAWVGLITSDVIEFTIP